jgi:hypothetical protein
MMNCLIPADQSEEPTEQERRALHEAVERCREEWRRVSIPTATGDAYAYPLDADSISWGINGGARGTLICRGHVRR